MRIIIDTDPAMGTLGGDPEDCFAIMVALNTPEVAVEGITVVQGNVPAERGYANARHLLAIALSPVSAVRYAVSDTTPRWHYVKDDLETQTSIKSRR